MTRVYHITLIFLALFCVIGGIAVFRMLSKIVRVAWTDKNVRIPLKILSVYFVIFMLYQTGFVYGVAEGNFYSISLNSTMDNPRFNNQEVLGAVWVCNVKDSGFIYADAYRRLLFLGFKWRQAGSFSVDADSRVTVPADSYIYLGTRNVVEHNVTVIHRSGVSNRLVAKLLF